MGDFLSEAYMFTWIPIYEETAKKVLEYEHRQRELIALLSRVRDKGVPTISLTDRLGSGRTAEFREVDPFTFFASFNRQVTDENRVEILREIKDAWGLESELPSDFDGIPVVQNLRSWF